MGVDIVLGLVGQQVHILEMALEIEFRRVTLIVFVFDTIDSIARNLALREMLRLEVKLVEEAKVR